MLLGPLKVPRTTPGTISGRSGPASWGTEGVDARRAAPFTIARRLARTGALRFRLDPLVVNLVVKPVGGAPGAGNEKRRESLRQRRFQMVEMGGLEPPTPTCEVILGQKTLPRKRSAKGAKAHSHRGLLAFRISRSFREFPRFSARMVVKWSSISQAFATP